MMTKAPRAFKIDPAIEIAASQGERERRLSSGDILIEEPETSATSLLLSPRPSPSRGVPWVGLLLSALGGLVGLWITLSIERMISQLFRSTPVLGWFASGLALTALVAFTGIIVHELRGIFREKRIEKMRRRAEIAKESNDEKAAISIVNDLVLLYASRPETAHARTRLAAVDPDAVIDAIDRLTIVERELFASLDRGARHIVANQAKQVSLVTAISPRAIVDVAFVLYACAKMVRQIAALYGGRPGLLGFLRLSGNVLSHLALTGGIAVGDGLVQQFMGLGVAARISAKLGEGVLNGLLTARVGLAAIEICRPLPFLALEKPRFSDVASSLFDRSKPNQNDTPLSED